MAQHSRVRVPGSSPYRSVSKSSYALEAADVIPGGVHFTCRSQSYSNCRGNGAGSTETAGRQGVWPPAWQSPGLPEAGLLPRTKWRLQTEQSKTINGSGFHSPRQGHLTKQGVRSRPELPLHHPRSATIGSRM